MPTEIPQAVVEAVDAYGHACCFLGRKSRAERRAALLAAIAAAVEQARREGKQEGHEEEREDRRFARWGLP